MKTLKRLREALAVWVAIVVAVFLLPGCTAIDRATKVDGWPALVVTEHPLLGGELWAKCYPALSPAMKALGAVPLACAWYDLNAGLCNIYYLRGFRDEDLIEHEREHCAGMSHRWSNQLQTDFDQWRKP